MTTYNTGNPVPSTAVKDLYDNAENLDYLLLGLQDYYPDRLGVRRISYRGIENQAQTALVNTGFEEIGDYDTDGPLTITRRNQVFTKDGQFYGASAALVLPYTTVSNWVTDLPNFVSRGDFVLRQDLAAPGGVGLVNGALRSVDTYADLAALTTGDMTRTLGYFAPGDGGGTEYYRVGPNWVPLIKNGEVSIRWFGAQPGLMTGNTAAIQAAIAFSLAAAQPLKIIGDAGQYYLDGTVQVNGQVEMQGAGIRDSGTIFYSDRNAPLFRVTAGCRLNNFAIKGSLETSKPLQSLIHIDSSGPAFNSPLFHNLHLQAGYDSVKQTGSNPVFYCDFDNVTWTDCINSFMYVNNTSSPGFDFIMRGCRMLGGAVNYAMNFDNGLGSALISDLQCSIVGTHPSQALVSLGVPANGFGGLQISNSVLEGGQFRILGLPLKPWKELHFSNSLFTGMTQVAMSIGECSGMVVQGSTFSSSNPNQIVEFIAGATSSGVVLDNPNFEGLGTAPCIKSLGSTTIQLSLKTPKWTGGAPVIDFSNVPATQLSLTANGGGTWGSAASSILLSDSRNTSGDFSAFGFEYGPMRRATFVGTTDGAGAATIPHGINQGHLKITHLFGVSKGGFGQAVPINPSNIAFDGVNIFLTNGGASTKYRVGIIWNTVPDTNW